MKKIIELMKTYILDLVRRPVNLLFGIIFALGLLLVTAFILNQGTTAEIVASYAVFVCAYAALQSAGYSVPEEKQKGLYRMYRSSKLSKSGYVLAKILQASIPILLSLVIVGIGYFTTGAYLSLLILPVLVLSILVHAGIGFIVAAYVETVEESQRIIAVIFVAMVFLAPVFYSPEGLPQIVRVIQKLVPLTYGVEAMRILMVDGGRLEQVWTHLAVLSALTVAALGAGYRALEF